MTSGLDMSLDDLIRKKNKKKKPSSSADSSNARHDGSGYTAGGGSGGRRASGPTRREPNRPRNRLGPYSELPKAPDSSWDHDLFTDQPGAVVGPVSASARVGGKTSSAIELGTKLFLSNLDYGVSDEDIKVLFSEVGKIKRYSINYDRSGRSKGTAEMVFARRADALAALKRYDGVPLDGKPMKVEIVGTNIETPLPLVPPVVVPVPLTFAGGFGFRNADAPMRGGFSGGWGPSGGGRFGAGARARGQGGSKSSRGGVGASKGKRKGPLSVSAADLDAELERYHASAKQTG